jgi:hypothetical protein
MGIDKLVKAEKLPYYEKLVDIREFMEDNSYTNFPLNCCQETAKLNTFIIPSLEEVAGFYKVEDPVKYDDYKLGHAWNLDSKRGLYVDLTADQFDLKNPKIMVFEIGNNPDYMENLNATYSQLDIYYDDSEFKENMDRLLNLYSKREIFLEKKY